ncbi:MAG: DeoR/GlpR family DNA-binding transcription regulator [Candidatus Limnocylindrales bacterium]
MIIAKRRQRIVETLRSVGVISVHDLATQLGASEATIRRDLRSLDASGMMRRTRGGAVMPGALTYEPSYAEKAGQLTAEKNAIAERALELIKPGDSIALGPGTTTLCLARLLPRVGELTVVTNSLLVAEALTIANQIEVIVTGGMLRRSIHALVGPGTEQALHGVRLDLGFMSGNGVNAERGLTTPNLLVAAADQAIAEACRQIVVLADHSKLGRVTMCQTVPPQRIDVLITDASPDSREFRTLLTAGLDIRTIHSGS